MAEALSAIAPAAAASGAVTNAQSQLASNFDTFLTLLTTQLRNQDPLEPMDSTEFTQQLVQFSQVEQQINANKNLEQLIALTQTRNGIDAISYLGKTVTMTDGSAALQDGEAEWTYTLNGEAAASVLTVADANGRLVYVGQGETANGEHSFVWDGRDNSGALLPDGGYVLSVQSLLADGSRADVAVRSQGVVDQVDVTGSEPLLLIGPLAVPLSHAGLIEETA